MQSSKILINVNSDTPDAQVKDNNGSHILGFGVFFKFSLETGEASAIKKTFREKFRLHKALGWIATNLIKGINFKICR